MIHSRLNEIILIIKEWFFRFYQEDLYKLILYGSQARGDAQEYSDIDILIVLNRNFNYIQELEKTGDFICNLSLEYDTLISRAFISKQSFEEDNSPFLLNVRREGISL